MPGETATNESNLNAVPQRNVQLEEQLAQQKRIAAALARQQQGTRTTTGDRLPFGTGQPVSFEGTGLPFDIAANPFSGNGFSNGSSSTFQQPASKFHHPFGTPGTTNPFGEATPGHPGYHSAPAFTFGASAGNGAFSFGGRAPYATDPIGASPHKSIGDQLHAMLNRGPGHHEQSHPNSTKLDQPKKAKDSMGTRLWNLCGWAHLQPHELNLLHRCNNGGWIKYNKAPDKGEKESVLDTYFIQQLIKRRLAPTNFEGTKPHGGLGPLTYVTRSTAERERLEYYRTLNSQCEPTTADMERSIPGTPQIPDTIDALITNLQLTQLGLVQVIGDRAPPPI